VTALLVSEVFGPTLQGEGPFMGRSASFLRLGMCNLACSWCDTPYTWDKERYNLSDEMGDVEVEALLPQLKAWRTPVVVITGGEPLMQQGKDGWPTLLRGLLAQGQSPHVETNGTITPNPATAALVDHFSVSPKLANSGDPEGKRLKVGPLSWFAACDRAIFKFVVTGRDDLDTIDRLIHTYGIAGDKVWIMPEGAEPEDTLNTMLAIADDVVARRWNLTTRLHVLCWGNVRGV
jgi:organic radical activating enzyme